MMKRNGSHSTFQLTGAEVCAWVRINFALVVAVILCEQRTATSQGSHRQGDCCLLQHCTLAIISSAHILLFMQIFAYLIVKSLSCAPAHTLFPFSPANSYCNFVK